MLFFTFLSALDCDEVVQIATEQSNNQTFINSLSLDCCNVESITCLLGRVKTINWSNLNLKGPLNSTAISLLNQLTSLNMSFNEISGEVPKMPNSLIHLDLSNNNLTSVEIDAFGMSLTNINLGYNTLFGSISLFNPIRVRLEQNNLSEITILITNQLSDCDLRNNILDSSTKTLLTGFCEMDADPTSTSNNETSALAKETSQFLSESKTLGTSFETFGASSTFWSLRAQTPTETLMIETTTRNTAISYALGSQLETTFSYALGSQFEPTKSLQSKFQETVYFGTTLASKNTTALQHNTTSALYNDFTNSSTARSRLSTLTKFSFSKSTRASPTSTEAASTTAEATAIPSDIFAWLPSIPLLAGPIGYGLFIVILILILIIIIYAVKYSMMKKEMEQMEKDQYRM